MGIIHRDLKPENFMLVDKTEDSDIKIVDFGLSRIIGPSEKCLDSFGTLTFVAPEILLQNPYNTSVDIWSLGVCSFLFMIGELPFDGDHENDLALNIVYKEPDYQHSRWNELSPDAKDFVKLLLEKDHLKRIKIEEALKHPFLLNKNKEILNLRQNSNDKDRFKLFSLIDPLNPNSLFADN